MPTGVLYELKWQYLAKGGVFRGLWVRLDPDISEWRNPERYRNVLFRTINYIYVVLLAQNHTTVIQSPSSHIERKRLSHFSEQDIEGVIVLHLRVSLGGNRVETRTDGGKQSIFGVVDKAESVDIFFAVTKPE